MSSLGFGILFFHFPCFLNSFNRLSVCYIINFMNNFIVMAMEIFTKFIVQQNEKVKIFLQQFFIHCLNWFVSKIIFTNKRRFSLTKNYNLSFCRCFKLSKYFQLVIAINVVSLAKSFTLGVISGN